MLENNLIDFTDDYNSVILNNFIECSNFNTNRDSFSNLVIQKYKLENMGFHFFQNEELAILSLLQYSKKDYITLYTPIPNLYHNICLKCDSVIDTIDCIENLDRDIKEDSIVIFTNPSLASGKHYDIEQHLEAWHKKNALVILIETSLEYTNKDSYIKYVHKYPNLFIIKNLAKFYGVTTIDTSIVIGNKEKVDVFKKYLPDSNILKFEIENLFRAINDITFHKTYKIINTKNNILLENILKGSPLIEQVYDSNTNIIMVEVDDIQYNYLKKNLNNYGIIIESNILRYKKNKYIRFCVKSNNDLLHLKYALEQIKEEF